MEMGEKRGKAWVLKTEFSTNHVVVRMKSGEGGYSVVVDLGRKGFYASYTQTNIDHSLLPDIGLDTSTGRAGVG